MVYPLCISMVYLVIRIDGFFNPSGPSNSTVILKRHIPVVDICGTGSFYETLYFSTKGSDTDP